MDFTFSQEQRELYETLCRFFMTEATPELTRELWDTETGRSPQMWQAMAEHGLQHSAAAELAFSKGRALAATRLHEGNAGSIQTGWTDWILAHALIREAEGLIHAPPDGSVDAPGLSP